MSNVARKGLERGRGGGLGAARNEPAESHAMCLGPLSAICPFIRGDRRIPPRRHANARSQPTSDLPFPEIPDVSTM